MKNKILNLILIIGYVWFAVALLYNYALPAEYKELLPEINGLTFLLSGTTVASVSVVIQYVKSLLGKQTDTNVTNLLAFHDMLKEQEDKIKELTNIITRQNNNIADFNTERKVEVDNQNKIISLLERNNKYQKTELESRITNPLIDQNIKKRIEVLLNEEKDNL